MLSGFSAYETYQTASAKLACFWNLPACPIPHIDDTAGGHVYNTLIRDLALQLGAGTQFVAEFSDIGFNQLKRFATSKWA